MRYNNLIIAVTDMHPEPHGLFYVFRPHCTNYDYKYICKVDSNNTKKQVSETRNSKTHAAKIGRQLQALTRSFMEQRHHRRPPQRRSTAPLCHHHQSRPHQCHPPRRKTGQGTTRTYITSTSNTSPVRPPMR